MLDFSAYAFEYNVDLLCYNKKDPTTAVTLVSTNLPRPDTKETTQRRRTGRTIDENAIMCDCVSM